MNPISSLLSIPVVAATFAAGVVGEHATAAALVLIYFAVVIVEDTVVIVEDTD